MVRWLDAVPAVNRSQAFSTEVFESAAKIRGNTYDDAR